MKLIRCRDHGYDCPFEAHGHDDAEVLGKAAHHATTEHQLQITPEVVEQVKASIHTVADLPA